MAGGIITAAGRAGITKIEQIEIPPGDPFIRRDFLWIFCLAQATRFFVGTCDSRSSSRPQVPKGFLAPAAKLGRVRSSSATGRLLEQGSVAQMNKERTGREGWW
jgi:hypothetical protein